MSLSNFNLKFEDAKEFTVFGEEVHCDEIKVTIKNEANKFVTPAIKPADVNINTKIDIKMFNITNSYLMNDKNDSCLMCFLTG